jgi:hypothetical protein
MFEPKAMSDRSERGPNAAKHEFLFRKHKKNTPVPH